MKLMSLLCIAVVVGFWPVATRAQVRSPEPILLLEPEFRIRQELIEPVKPEYPEAARQAGIQGEVLMFVRYDKDGKLLDAQPLRSPDKSLSEAVVNALKQSRIKPHAPIYPKATYASEITFIFQLKGGDASVVDPPLDELVQLKVSKEFNDYHMNNKEFRQEVERRQRKDREEQRPQ